MLIKSAIPRDDKYMPNERIIHKYIQISGQNEQKIQKPKGRITITGHKDNMHFLETNAN